MANYVTELPSLPDIREGLQYAYEYWQPRNKFIALMRDMLVGANKIEAPTNTSYKIRTLHTYLLASIINEKSARFTQLPKIQIVPNDDIIGSRELSSKLELGINVAMSEMENRSDGDVWSRCILDAVSIDEGVERIERAPAAFWPEIIDIHNGKSELPMESEFTQAVIKKYKKRYGIPVRSIYVPLENFFPIYEGPSLIESYEIDVRTLRDVLRNPLFSGAREALGTHNPDTREGLRTKVSIVHYVNSVWHAYYALVPTSDYRSDSDSIWPNLTESNLTNVGEPVLLHSYKHNLGTSIYNCISGRFGGWKSSSNRIEGVAKGLLELNQGGDEVFSQVFTNVRAKYWPTMLQKIDSEQRGYTLGGTEPKKLTVPEGQDLVIFSTEDVGPLFKPTDDPMVGWLFDRIEQQIGRLGGSPVIFGQNQPGVETGYHQALQITQSEHLDEKIEQHLSIGAVNRATLILKHIKEMNLGEVYVNTSTSDNGKRINRAYSIDPEELSPLPIMDAQVRRPRPVDFAASIRSAREASDERQGKGPLLSDDTIRQDLLNITAPDIEENKILIQSEKNKIIASGVITQKVVEALNLKLLVSATPETANPKVPPMAQEAANQATTQQNAAQNPQPDANAQPNASASPVPLPPGMPTGQSQPEAISGNQIATALRAGG